MFHVLSSVACVCAVQDMVLFKGLFPAVPIHTGLSTSPVKVSSLSYVDLVGVPDDCVNVCSLLCWFRCGQTAAGIQVLLHAAYHRIFPGESVNKDMYSV